MEIPADIAGARDAVLRAVAEQRQAEEDYRKIFEGSVDGIYVTTPEGKILNANPALARMMGYDSPQQLIDGVSDIAHIDLRRSGGARRVSAAHAPRRHGARVRVSGAPARRRHPVAVRQRDRRARRERPGAAPRGDGARHHRPAPRRAGARRQPPPAADRDRQRAGGDQRQGHELSLSADEPLHGAHLRRRSAGGRRAHHQRDHGALWRLEGDLRRSARARTPARSSASTKRPISIPRTGCGTGWPTRCRCRTPTARSNTSSPSRSTSPTASAASRRRSGRGTPPRTRSTTCARRRTR